MTAAIQDAINAKKNQPALASAGRNANANHANQSAAHHQDHAALDLLNHQNWQRLSIPIIFAFQST